MNLNETNLSRLSLGEYVTLGLMVVVVVFSFGYFKGENDSLQRQVNRLEAQQTYGLLVPKNPGLAPVYPETTTPPTTKLPKQVASRSVKLGEGETIWDGLYSLAFSKGYPEYIYRDGDEQRRESLALIDQWIKQIELQIAAGPVCVRDLPCITDINVVPVGTVIKVSLQMGAFISSEMMTQFAN